MAPAEGGGETAIHEARDVTFEGGGQSWGHGTMFSMVQDAAGTVTKTRRCPAKRGQPELGNGGEGGGHQGEASIPVHVGKAIPAGIPDKDTEGGGMRHAADPNNGGREGGGKGFRLAEGDNCAFGEIEALV